MTAPDLLDDPPPQPLLRAIRAIRIGSGIQVLILLVLLFSAAEVRDPVLAVILVVYACLLLVATVVEEVMVHAMLRRRSWSWTGGLVAAALESTTLLFPVTIIVLIGLLDPRTRAWFERGSTAGSQS